MYYIVYKIIYYSRLSPKKLKEIKFFEGSKVKRIGASFNHFYLQNDKDNKWYSNKAFEGQELVKLYSELGLCQLEDGYFEGTKIEHISGKYANVFAF